MAGDVQMIAKLGQTGNLNVTPWQAITQAAQKNGLPPWIALDIAQVESGLNPLATVKDTNGAMSVGLFQLNQKGQGAGYSVSQLQNATTNANMGVKALVPAYKKGVSQGLKGAALLDYVANNSGHPGNLGVTWTQTHEPSYDARLNAIYQGSGGTNVSTPSQLGAAASATYASDVGSSGGAATLTNGSGFGTSAFAFFQEIDNIETFQGFDILNPVGSLLNDSRAIGFRAFLFLLGLILVIFGLVAIVGKQNIMNAAAMAAM